jgi:hypothetical protein
MAKPTADWEKVGDKFYRKIQLYTAVFDQDLELENYIVTGAPYAGAIGTLTTSLRRRCLSTLFCIYKITDSYESSLSVLPSYMNCFFGPFCPASHIEYNSPN